MTLFWLHLNFYMKKWTSCQLHLKNKFFLTSWKAKLLRDSYWSCGVSKRCCFKHSCWKCDRVLDQLPWKHIFTFLSLFLCLGFNVTYPEVIPPSHHRELLPGVFRGCITHCNTWCTMFLLRLLCSVSLWFKGISTSYLLFTEIIVDPASKNIEWMCIFFRYIISNWRKWEGVLNLL